MRLDKLDRDLEVEVVLEDVLFVFSGSLGFLLLRLEDDVCVVEQVAGNKEN